MARYSLFVLKVPLNTNQPTNLTVVTTICLDGSDYATLSQMQGYLACYASVYTAVGNTHLQNDILLLYYYYAPAP